MFRLALALPTALYLGTLWRYRAARAPDGYDAVGFALALERFDLARLQPHPPGYPVLVVLGRGLRALGFAPVTALALANALGLGLGLSALAALLRRLGGKEAGWLGLLLLPLAPLCWALGTGSLSDGLGLGLLLLAIAVLPPGPADSAGSAWRLASSGALAGVALGARPSYAPLAGLLLLPLLGSWRRVGLRRISLLLGGAALGVVAWLLPLLGTVGPRRYLVLCLAHLRGHVQDFGGSVATDAAPLARVPALLEGAAAGALGPHWPAALLLIGVALLRAHLGSSAGPGQGSTGVRRAARRVLLFLAGGYTLFVLLLQPVRGHGRHLLPLCVTALALLALALGPGVAAVCQRAQAPGSAPRRGGLLLIAALVLLQASGAAAWIAALRGQEPPATRLAQRVDRTSEADAALYGARAARALDWLRGAGTARPARYLGEVIVDLSRRPTPPAEALITSEVKAAPASRRQLRELARFCPPAALPALLQFDREPGADPCLALLAYRVSP